jgi:Flp pilus assembly protein CpaB
LSTRARTILIVFVGLLLFIVGVGASLLMISRINAQTQAAQQSQVVKTPVVVVTHDMSLGAKISAADVVIAQIPVDVIPRDALSTPEDAIGRIIKSDLVQGEMVLMHNLADPTNNNHDLSFILSNDHVLMAFPATDLMSVENIIQRGDVIDILATFPVSNNKLGTGTLTTTTTGTTTTGTTTTTNQDNTFTNFTSEVFQKVSVTALVLKVVNDQNGQPVGYNNTAYLLALNPQDALVLKYLKDSQAVFDIVLRSPTSQNNFDTTAVTDQYIIELLGLQLLP